MCGSEGLLSKTAAQNNSRREIVMIYFVNKNSTLFSLAEYFELVKSFFFMLDKSVRNNRQIVLRSHYNSFKMKNKKDSVVVAKLNLKALSLRKKE